MGRAQRASMRPSPRGSADRLRWQRWLGWLLTGLTFGLLIGFAAGLTRPRATASLTTTGSNGGGRS